VSQMPPAQCVSLGHVVSLRHAVTGQKITVVGLAL
jgi:hypothetical protein